MKEPRADGHPGLTDLEQAVALAAEHQQRLPSRLPRWRLEGTLFAALSNAAFDLRPNLVSRDGERGFLIDATQRRFALQGLESLDYGALEPNGTPWQATPLADDRVFVACAKGPRWDAIDSLRFVACLLESNGAIAMPIELGKRYKMLKWPDLAVLPDSRALLRPYLRHSKELARGSRSIGEILAHAGDEWREALAFANACAMLDLLQVVEEE